MRKICGLDGVKGKKDFPKEGNKMKEMGEFLNIFRELIGSWITFPPYYRFPCCLSFLFNSEILHERKMWSINY